MLQPHAGCAQALEDDLVGREIDCRGFLLDPLGEGASLRGIGGLHVKEGYVAWYLQVAVWVSSMLVYHNGSSAGRLMNLAIRSDGRGGTRFSGFT